MSFEIIFRNLLGDAEESHKNLRKDWEILVPRFETWTSRIRRTATSRRTTLRTTLSREAGLSLRKAMKNSRVGSVEVNFCKCHELFQCCMSYFLSKLRPSLIVAFTQYQDYEKITHIKQHYTCYISANYALCSYNEILAKQLPNNLIAFWVGVSGCCLVPVIDSSQTTSLWLYPPILSPPLPCSVTPGQRKPCTERTGLAEIQEAQPLGSTTMIIHYASWEEQYFKGQKSF